jgi:hypothetical protein
MVEPLAAVVLNSLLSSRSTLGYSLSLKSVARATKSTSRMLLTSDFFTPQPRRVKGKEKAEIALNLPCHLSQCQEWSSCAQRHSLWCPREFTLQIPPLYIYQSCYFRPKPVHDDEGNCSNTRPTVQTLYESPHTLLSQYPNNFHETADTTHVQWPTTARLGCSRHCRVRQPDVTRICPFGHVSINHNHDP